MQKASSWATAWPPLTLAVLGAIAPRMGSGARLLDGNVEPLTLEARCRRTLRKIRRQPGGGSTRASLRLKTTWPWPRQSSRRGPRGKGRGVRRLLYHAGTAGVRRLSGARCRAGGRTRGHAGRAAAALAAAGRTWRRSAAWPAFAGGIVLNAPRPLIDDLDRLPMPDRSFLKNDRYRLPHNNRVFTLVPTGRGFPFPAPIASSTPTTAARRGSAGARHRVRDPGLRVSVRHRGVSVLGGGIYPRQGLRAGRMRGDRKGRLEDSLGRHHPRHQRRRGRPASHETGRVLPARFGNRVRRPGDPRPRQKRQTVEDVRRAWPAARGSASRPWGISSSACPAKASRPPRKPSVSCSTSISTTCSATARCLIRRPSWASGPGERLGSGRPLAQYDFGGDSIMDTEQLTCQEVTLFRKKAFRRFYFRPPGTSCARCSAISP